MSSISPYEAQPPLVLALDLGTSAVRTLLFDHQGRALEGRLVRRKVNLLTRPDGTVTMEADSLLKATCECLDEIMAMEPQAEIEGIGCCTFVSNVLGVDKDDQAVTPVFTYADTRPAGYVSQLRSRLDEAACHQRTGTLFHPSYLPARFLWLAQEHPAWIDPPLRWMSIGEYILLHLCGETAASYSVASWSGMLDRRGLEWDAGLLEVLPIRKEQLSRLVDVGQSYRGLLPHYALRWPRLKDVSWFPAVGDGAAANLGSGCVSARQVAVTMGSTSALRMVLEGSEQQVPKGLWCYRVDGERSLLGGAMSEGGNIYTWLQNTLRLGDVQDTEAELGLLPPDGHGLTFLPLLAGERAPGWKGDARGVISGLSLATAPLELLQAGLEGVALRAGLIYQLLKPHLGEDVTIIASGGALSNSPFMVQLLADVFGRQVSVSETAEASARGAAMLALRALGVMSSLEKFPAFTGAVFQPNPDRHLLYQKAMLRQQELYADIYNKS